MKNNELDYKVIQYDLKSDDDTGEFEGYLSIYGNVDGQGEVVLPGAFDSCLDTIETLPLLWSHEQDEVIGVINSIKSDNVGLYVKGKLNFDVEKAKEVYSLIKQGAVKGLSIGYKTITSYVKNKIRMLKELDLKEGSIVAIPSNDKALILGFKGSFNDNLRATQLSHELYDISDSLTGAIHHTVNNPYYDDDEDGTPNQYKYDTEKMKADVVEHMKEATDAIYSHIDRKYAIPNEYKSDDVETKEDEVILNIFSDFKEYLKEQEQLHEVRKAIKGKLNIF